MTPKGSQRLGVARTAGHSTPTGSKRHQGIMNPIATAGCSNFAKSRQCAKTLRRLKVELEQ